METLKERHLKKVVEGSKVEVQKINNDESRAIRLNRKFSNAQGPDKIKVGKELLELFEELEKTAEKNKIYNKKVIEAEKNNIERIINNLSPSNN